jgi:branched-chain amino acid transport system permease protein
MMSWIELQTVLCYLGILSLLAMSLNLMCGVTGLLQLGHAGFFAIGAYSAGLYAIYCTIPQLGWFNFIPGAIVAIVVTITFAFLIGIPSLKLRGDYFAVVTLGFGEIVRLLLTSIEFPGGKMFPGEKIGGPTGISFTESPSTLWQNYPEFSAEYATIGVIWLAVIFTYIFLVNLKKSAIGRAMMCIREDEIVAQTMGINVPQYKILSFVISAGLAGFAGALFFHYQLRINPSNFSLLKSIEVLLIVVLGGLGSFFGSICASVVLGFLPYLLRHVDLSNVACLPGIMRKSLSEYNMIIYALLLIFLIRVVPSGILGMHELPAFCDRKQVRNKK